jgi:hypothetical protein
MAAEMGALTHQKVNCIDLGFSDVGGGGGGLARASNRYVRRNVSVENQKITAIQITGGNRYYFSR